MVVVFGVSGFVPGALADSGVSITSDTAVFLSDPGITLILASGSTLVSYSADATALTVNLDAGSSVTVKSNDAYVLTNSQNTSTHCSGTAYSYVPLTASGPTAVTVTPATAVACTSSGGGSGSTIYPPTINSFVALPAAIQPGQSSALSWKVTGASKVSITPTVSTNSLNTISGTATVTPASTTTYTLTAFNTYGQSVTATTTVTVMASSPAQQPSPIDQQPSQPTTTPAATITPAYCLVNRSGTFSLILSGIRRGIANPGLLYSYGYGFNDAVKDTAAYQSLPSSDLLGPNDGALVKSPANPTVYLISGQARHGFTSASVFRSLGYKFSSVLTIPAPQLNGLAEGSIISDPKSRHLPGANISSRGTIYLLGDTVRNPYPSLAVYNTWNLRNDFSRVVPANAADLALLIGSVVTPRSGCNGQ